jgi:hypothetical protein
MSWRSQCKTAFKKRLSEIETSALAANTTHRVASPDISQDAYHMAHMPARIGLRQSHEDFARRRRDSSFLRASA